MVLTVPYKEFPEACKRVGAKEIYLSPNGKGTLATVADLHKQIVVATKSDQSFLEVSQELEAAGFTILQGRWGDGEPAFDENHNVSAFVVAVSYHSSEAMPGLWMDAFPTPPTPQIVLRTMFDEFRSNGELGEVTYEDFLKYAKPNVVILSPGEIATYLSEKEEC